MQANNGMCAGADRDLSAKAQLDDALDAENAARLRLGMRPLSDDEMAEVLRDEESWRRYELRNLER